MLLSAESVSLRIGSLSPLLVMYFESKMNSLACELSYFPQLSLLQADISIGKWNPAYLPFPLTVYDFDLVSKTVPPNTWS